MQIQDRLPRHNLRHNGVRVEIGHIRIHSRSKRTAPDTPERPAKLRQIACLG